MYNQSELKKIVDKAIINLSYNTEAEKLIDPVKYILSMGGKRLQTRPFPDVTESVY